MVGDAGCERINKEKKVQSQVFILLSKRGKRLGAEIYTSIEGWGL